MRWLPIFAWLAVSRVAAAEPQLDPVTSRNYAIDLYSGVPFGNSAVIAVGGAAAANASGSSGTLINVSAPAVRSTTDLDSWGWDYHLDYLNASLSSDYTNSGLPTSDTFDGSSAFTGGLALRYHNFAIAVTGTEAYVQVGTVATPGSATTPLQASTLRAQAAVAKWVPELDMAFGAAFDLAQFDLKPDCTGTGCNSVFTISGGGFEAGAQWLPHLQDFRLGAAVATPIAGGKVGTSCGTQAECDGFILPDKVVEAWRFTTGAAYRFAPTRWNQQVPGTFRDERAVTITADLVVTGQSANAYGLDAFALHELERSGRHSSWSPRGGAEYEWLPGRLRIRAGSYWEPERFVGVDGRLHVTFGVEVRVFQVDIWGLRRGRITLTGDVASQYQNGGLSIGFWH